MSQKLEKLIEEGIKIVGYSPKDLASFLSDNGCVVAKEILEVDDTEYFDAGYYLRFVLRKGKLLKIKDGTKIAIIEEDEDVAEQGK